MGWFEAILLGIVQGLTEFLPISSTGHVRIVPALFGWEDPGAAFSAVIQLGTMAAVLIYFRTDIARITVAFLRGLRHRELRRTPDSLMGWYVAVGTVPVVIFGFAFRHQISTGARSLLLISTVLVIGGIIMLAVDRIAVLQRGIDSVSWRDGIIIGLCQALALVPGVSRSGATIVGGLVLGFDRETAARFSFLLSIPAVVLSGLFELKDVGDGSNNASIVATIIATVFAFIFGYAAIAFLLRYLARHTLTIFGVYRIVVGLAVMALVLTDTIS
ncbi:MAG: undecaprenyl-diphosphate phosphatase [Gaiellales bacterium]